MHKAKSESESLVGLPEPESISAVPSVTLYSLVSLMNYFWGCIPNLSVPSSILVFAGNGRNTTVATRHSDFGPLRRRSGERTCDAEESLKFHWTNLFIRSGCGQLLNVLLLSPPTRFGRNRVAADAEGNREFDP